MRNFLKDAKIVIAMAENVNLLSSISQQLLFPSFFLKQNKIVSFPNSFLGTVNITQITKLFVAKIRHFIKA